MADERGGDAKQDEGAFRQLVASLPEDYEGRFQRLVQISRSFHATLATALTAPLNEYLRAAPQDDLAGKRQLAARIGDDLRQLHLAVRCPKTGRPATLLADAKDRDSDQGRFRLDVRDELGRNVRTLTRQALPLLELMEDPPPREGRSPYRHR